MFKRKKALTQKEVRDQIAKIRKANDDTWRIATQRVAVDIRKGYTRKGV